MTTLTKPRHDWADRGQCEVGGQGYCYDQAIKNPPKRVIILFCETVSVLLLLKGVSNTLKSCSDTVCLL